MLLVVSRRFATALCLSAVFSFAFAATAIAQTAPAPAAPATPTPAAPPKKQLPADQRAFRAAQAVVDPEKRLAAFRQFIQTYPKSSRADRAQSLILEVLLKNFPDRTTEIDAQAKLVVKKAAKAKHLQSTESDVADQLADAGSSGVDLEVAEKWAKDAVDKESEKTYDKETLKDYKKFKQPPPSAADLHKDYAESRANSLAALANVYLRQGNMAAAKSALAEAYALDPMIDEVNALRGELALTEHKDAEALTDFERAQLLGELKPRLRPKVVPLYRQLHNGTDVGLTAEMDARYAELYPAGKPPAKHAPVPGGHTVLLELFTGSACPPCVGGDLAIDDILESYPRSEVVALAFDQHIPEPDPLANPDSAARGDVYNLTGTPSYAVDGKLLNMYGASREGSEKLYGKLTKELDPQLAKPSGVQLKLTAARNSDGTISAQAQVVTGDAAALADKPTPAADAAKAATAADKNKTVATPPPAASEAPAAPPQLVVNFALVEDHIRYSGENGIRFHRMVVRSLAKPAESGFPIALANTATVDASFNPAEISKKWADYLTTYEKDNPRFGQVQFLTKDTTMQPNALAVAAWVEDATTHRVLQSAYFPLGGM